MSKLLTIDVGNTNIKLGVFEKDKVVHSWRLSVKTVRTGDEFGIQMLNLFNNVGMKFDEIKGIVMSSVSPSVNYTIEHACDYYIGQKPLMVTCDIETGIKIKYDNPAELGTDRIVNSLAAYKFYGGPCVVIDFGTATTFNAISKKGEFLGGVIAPGIKSSVNALVDNTAKLANIELNKPKKIICKNTENNMQAGAIYGFTGLVDYLVTKMKKEMKDDNIKVIATGGLSSLIAEEKKDLIDIIDRFLTLQGLRLVYELNTK